MKYYNLGSYILYLILFIFIFQQSSFFHNDSVETIITLSTFNLYQLDLLNSAIFTEGC
jgi:hypothetical protein